MDYRIKLLELVRDLNILGNDEYFFMNRAMEDIKWGEFKVDIKDGFLNVDGVEKDAVDVLVYFKDGEGLFHPIQKRIFVNVNSIDINEFFRQFYYEFLRQGLLGVDAVNFGLDSETGININYLTFRTILDTGLQKLKTK